jgi:biopolymer transport protein ExbB/TolQ
MIVLMIIYILIVLVFGLILFAIAQIKLAGIEIKDFWGFIEANQLLEQLYRFAKKYDKLTSQEQLIFLMEAEKVFNAFDKVPNMLWEEEYQKYMEVLDKYKDIKVVRWSQN